MELFWILILVAFFATNSLEKAESVDLFDEIFGEGWWDNEKDEEWNKLTLEQNSLHQIGRQNNQIGLIEPNSTDQNSPLKEFDHSDNPKNGEEQNQIVKEMSSNKKRKIIDKFHAMKEELKQKGKYPTKEWAQIEKKIAKHLKVNRTKIYKWKKEIGLNRRNPKNKRQNLIEKFDQKKAELKRAGFKNSYPNQINETVAKELGLTFVTIYAWKRELCQSKPKHIYSHSEQKELMKRYYHIKDKNPLSDEEIAKILNIGRATLDRWKRQFKRQQLHTNSVDGHFVKENAAEKLESEI